MIRFWKWVCVGLAVSTFLYTLVVWDNLDSIHVLNQENVTQNFNDLMYKDILLHHNKNFLVQKQQIESLEKQIEAVNQQNRIETSYLVEKIAALNLAVDSVRKEIDLTDNVEYAMSHVFCVNIRVSKEHYCVGTCTLLDKEKGIFLTAGHVVWNMILDGSTIEQGETKIPILDFEFNINYKDLGLIFVDPNLLSELSWEEILVREHDVVPGELILSAGYAWGNPEPYCTLGIAGNRSQMVNPGGDVWEVTRLDIIVIEGMSGGPILDREGFVVGVNSFGEEFWHAVQSVEEIQEAITVLKEAYEDRSTHETVGVSDR